MKAHLWLLNNILKESAINLNNIIVATNASVKNNITTFISYIISSQNILKKIIHHAINVIFTEVESFSIRYSINQAV